MANNLNYTATIDVDWLKFKEQNGVVITTDGSGVTTLQTVNSIPNSLKLIVTENTGATRSATITFTQEGGETKTITIRQNSNKAGVFVDGDPYFDISKSGLVISRIDGGNGFTSTGGTATFKASYTEVYSINKYQTDSDGIEIKRWNEESSRTTKEVTKEATWNVNPKGTNNSNISLDGDVAKLTVGENKGNGSPNFTVMASYNNLNSNAISIQQEGVAVDWVYKVKTNESGTTVVFLNNNKEVLRSEAVLEGDAYYASYSVNSMAMPHITAYISKKNLVGTPKITLYEMDREDIIPDDFVWEANPNGDSMQLDAVYTVSVTPYKYDNDVSNPIAIGNGETVTINSYLNKAKEFKEKANDTKSKSQWITVIEKTRYTFRITASKAEKTRMGYVNFKYSNEENGLPEAVRRFNISQKVK